MTPSTAPSQSQPPMPFGANLLPGGGVDFRLWAPAASRAELVLAGAGPGGDDRVMRAEANPQGWYRCTVDSARAGTLYAWRIDGDTQVPDPASRFNPCGVHGPSEVIDPHAFAWDTNWAGRPWPEAVIYELHVGAFTPEGTYAAAEGRLQQLADTGITAIELMPVADFPGHFGWGYDGVLHFAPHGAYGRPDDLKHLVQAAHRIGLQVFLDVVYNHFGPDGNYLHGYAPAFFSKTHQNPWGASINFDGEDARTVRDFYIANALYWIGEYRMDGLRFDAIHAIVDDSRPDIMEEISQAVRARFPERHVHLILENEHNAHQRLADGPRPGSYTAQWNDDFHHAMHVALTGETGGYYGDYADDPVRQVAHALTDGYIWAGCERKPGGGRTERRHLPAMPLPAMVNFIGNHDQAGNRAFGERIRDLMPGPARPVAMAILLLSPPTPMLFFGEEFDSSTPFLYFADWSGDLKRAVTEGRQREFAAFMQAAAGRQTPIPPPCEPGTFEASRLDWEQADAPAGRSWRAFVQQALALRRSWLVPRAAKLLHGRHVAVTDGRALRVRWRYEGGEVLELRANLGPDAVDGPQDADWPALAGASELFAVNRPDGGAWAGWSASFTVAREA